MIRIVFFGTPDIAERVLTSCLSSDAIDIVAVIAQPDSRGGRGHELLEPPTKFCAQYNNIPCLQPEKLAGNQEFQNQLLSFGADVFLVCAYGKILPQSILDIPSRGCLNIHFSKLPEYRGASPIQQALLDGKSSTGISIQIMNAEMDAGDLVAFAVVSIADFDTSQTLFARCAEVAGPLIIQTLLSLEEGAILPIPQDHDRATYTSKITKSDGVLDDFSSVMKTFFKWKAYTPWPGVCFFLGTTRIFIEKCSYLRRPQSGQCGQVVKLPDSTRFPLPKDGVRQRNIFGIIHEDGVLILLQVKPEGKKSMSADGFFHGFQSLFSSPETGSSE